MSLHPPPSKMTMLAKQHASRLRFVTETCCSSPREVKSRHNIRHIDQLVSKFLPWQIQHQQVSKYKECRCVRMIDKLMGEGRRGVMFRQTDLVQ